MGKTRPSTQFETPHHAAHQWPRRTSMPSVFTAFVRNLQGEETPDADLFHDAWHRLRAVLANEMRKRGLWQSPPCYLGVFGWEHWNTGEAAVGARAQASALGELVADCYAFIFVDRLQSLKRHLAEKPDIDGLVLLNIRHFLHERQKAQDPLGFQIFELLQAAVEEAVSSGSLHVLSGDGRVRNDTLLGFSPTAEPRSMPPDLDSIAVRWNDELLPALITSHSRTARGHQQAVAVERLLRQLLELPRDGVEAFRFRDLLEPLKSDARQRWAALLGSKSEEEPGESRQSLEHLTRCVSASIRRMETDPRTRTYLSALWRYLRRQHGGDGEPGVERPPGKSRPSFRQLGQLLNIPRERFPMLLDTLRQLVARCRTGGARRQRSGIRPDL
jgi:hypothetical protein